MEDEAHEEVVNERGDGWGMGVEVRVLILWVNLGINEWSSGFDATDVSSNRCSNPRRWSAKTLTLLVCVMAIGLELSKTLRSIIDASGFWERWSRLQDEETYT